MQPIRFLALVPVACLCLTAGRVVTSAAQAPPAESARRQLKVVHQVPVVMPEGLDAGLKPVVVQVDAKVAADGAVADVRAVAITIVAEKVEMTADPATIRKNFDALAKAASDSVRQWRFEPPAEPAATVRVSVRFEVATGTATVLASRPVSGYPPNVSAALPAGVLKVGGAVKAPKKLVHVAPTYPQEAIDGKVQGVVVLDVVLDADGVPSDVQVAQSVPMLDAAAVEAVRKWRYEPTLMNGVPVPLAMTVTVNFMVDP